MKPVFLFVILLSFGCNENHNSKARSHNSKAKSDIPKSIGMIRLHEIISKDRTLRQFEGGDYKLFYEGLSSQCPILIDIEPFNKILLEIRRKVEGKKIIVIRMTVKGYSPYTHLGGVAYLFFEEDDDDMIGKYISV